MIYAITYDLKTPGQDYSALYATIHNLGETLHPLQNLWLLNTGSGLNSVRDQLRTVIDQNDFVFVAQLYKSSYSAWMPVTAHEWLEARL